MSDPRYDRIAERVHPGATVEACRELTGGVSATIEALPRILAGLRERGLRFARLDELLELEPYRAPSSAADPAADASPATSA